MGFPKTVNGVHAFMRVRIRKSLSCHGIKSLHYLSWGSCLHMCLFHRLYLRALFRLCDAAALVLDWLGICLYCSYIGLSKFFVSFLVV